ncbi:MAG: phosphoesterase [Planctomycetota bacterium]|nr:MAG: phosphoesterase [Planctomycetota bacterium]
MLAFVSDIHGNAEALNQVWAKIERQSVQGIYCLGDVIGYGPEPRECLLAVIERCEMAILGNHEQGALYYASDFNPKARKAIDWTKAQLNAGERDENFRLWNYISDMPETYVFSAGGTRILLAHGSPRDPVREYLMPPDGGDEMKMRGCFEKMGRAQLCLVGHSHVPGVFTQSGGFRSPAEFGGSFQLEDEKAIVNIGSVGQPRDGDPRASYVCFDPEARVVHFYRVEYEVERTMAKIRGTELDEYLAQRLASGR